MKSFGLAALVLGLLFRCGLGIADARDDRLHANFLKLCQGGKERGGARTIGEIVLDCPEDKFEADATKQQIRALARQICSDAARSCSVEATRVFETMECKPVLGVERSEKCGPSTGVAKAPKNFNLCARRLRVASFSLMSNGWLEQMDVEYSDGRTVRAGTHTTFGSGEETAPSPEQLQNWQRANSRRRGGPSVTDLMREVHESWINANCDFFFQDQRTASQKMIEGSKALVLWVIQHLSCDPGDVSCRQKADRLKARVPNGDAVAVRG